LKFEEEKSYPVHAVSLVEHETGIVLTQGHVERADTETKGEPTEQKPGKKGKPGEPTEQVSTPAYFCAQIILTPL